MTYGIAGVLYIPLGRILSAEDFGLYTEATLVYSGIVQIVEQSLLRAFIRAPGNPDGVAQTALWLSAIIGAVGVLVCAVSGVPLAFVFNEARLELLMLLLAPAVLAIALGTLPHALLSRELDFRRKLLPEAISVIAGAVVGIGAARAGAGVYSLIFYTLVRVVVNTIVAWLVVRWRPTRAMPRPAVLRDLLTFGAPAAAGELGYYARLNVDVTITALRLGAAPLGIYSLAWETSFKPAQFINAAFRDVGYATFARLGAGDRLRRMYISATRLIAAVAIPLFLCALLVRQEAVLTVFTDRKAAMIEPLAPLFLLQMLWVVAFPCTSVILALGHSRFYAWVNNGGFILAIGAVWVGVQNGVTGVAWAMLLAVGAVSMVWLGYAWLLLGLRLPDVTDMLRVAGVAALTTVLPVSLLQVLLGTLHLPVYARLVACFAVALIGYTAAARLCWPTLRRDIAVLRARLPE